MCYDARSHERKKQFWKFALNGIHIGTCQTANKSPAFFNVRFRLHEYFRGQSATETVERDRTWIVKERTVVYLSSLSSLSKTGNGQENDSNSVAHKHMTYRFLYLPGYELRPDNLKPNNCLLTTMLICCMLSFGWFPGVRFLYADVSEHCSIFIGR